MIKSRLQRIKFLSSIIVAAMIFTSMSSDAAISLQSGYYFEDFNGSSLDSNAWWISKQENNAAVDTLSIKTYNDGGVTQVTGAGSGDRLVNGVGPTGVTYPLPAIVAPRSYAEFGFSGGWLTNSGALVDSAGGGYANGSTSAVRSATLSFNDLAAHTKIDHISFLIGSGDSIDAAEGVFEVKLGNAVIFRRDFDGSGVTNNPVSGFPNVTTNAVFQTLIQGANLKKDGFYRESWIDDTSENSRRAESWTLDGAHRVTFTDLAHTGSTLDLTFSWYGLNADFLDEFIAIDNLLIMVPEPSKAVLLIAGLGTLALRRSRKA